ncbi:MAG: bL28 family ribosomal protein [Candidatus Magasanikbacteria bacterium]
MPKCENCRKGSQKAANRSHAKNRTNRRQKPNLQKHDGEMICTSCMRTKAKQ